MYTYYLSLGSNVGDRQGYLNTALEDLRKYPGIESVQASSWIETEPWGLKEQPAFLNGLLICLASLNPVEMLTCGQFLEEEAKRKRVIRWGPRTLDVDIVWAEQDGQALRIQEADLQIPHPYFWDRDFVLRPLAELLPEFSYQGQPVQDRLRELQGQALESK